jgi:hypothetical protein
MTHYPTQLTGVLALLLGASAPALAGAPPASKAVPLDETTLAARIDELISARWSANRVRPAPLATDAEFLRRVHLDLAGKIPRVSEVRRFLADTSPDKRRQVVGRLLASPGYANHWTNLWRPLLMPDGDDEFSRGKPYLPGLERWLRRQFRNNTGFDLFTRQLLAMPFEEVSSGTDAATPLGFYMARNGRPEELATATARLFLGVRLECAQCHDHPNASWQRQQFWQLAAFFAGIRHRSGNPSAPLREVNDWDLAIPRTEQVVTAAFLDDSKPPRRSGRLARTALADWVTNPTNSYFARAAVNRLWAELFGLGLVEPIDDFRDDNPASHPELLDVLARQFVLHGYDVKYILRALTRTRVYQLSSIGRPGPDARLFSRMAVKGLTPEQFYDSFVLATGYFPPAESTGGNAQADGERGKFLALFGTRERRTEVRTSIPQALALMNGAAITQATRPASGGTLRAVIDGPFRDNASRIETLFLATLSRKPRADEARRMLRYVEDEARRRSPGLALSDVLWALLNSSEFCLNH